MAPQKRKAAATAVTADKSDAAEIAPPGRRVTRSVTRQLENPVAKSAPPPKAVKKPRKKETGERSRTTAAEIVIETVEAVRELSADEQDNKATSQMSETTTDDNDEVTNVAAKIVEEVASGSSSKSSTSTVVIEHCKQCNRFKTRAHQVQKGLEEAVPGITVLLNPEKPRRGCFEVRMEGGDTFISLLGMQRPFPQLTALNMEEVIADIIGKIKA